MIFDKIDVAIGMIKLFFSKIVFFNRIQIKGIPRINSSFKLKIRRKTKLIISKGFRARERLIIRIAKRGKVEIGEKVFINDNCGIHCLDHIIIGNNVNVGPNVTMFDHDHDYKNDFKNFVTQKIEIEDNVWIGANVLILKGVKIGKGAVIAGGSIVKSDVESNTLYYNKIEEGQKKIK